MSEPTKNTEWKNRNHWEIDVFKDRKNFVQITLEDELEERRIEASGMCVSTLPEVLAHAKKDWNAKFVSVFTKGKINTRIIIQLAVSEGLILEYYS